jgi:thiosulfate dehydrogenase
VRAAVLLALTLAACSPHPKSPTDTAAADTTLRAPDGTGVPAGALGASVLRGHAILLATRDSLPQHVGSALRCVSCHLNDGRNPTALPLTGVYARFPQYRTRVAAVQRIEDRVNDCFERSLNGTALAFNDPAMRDIVAYLAFISHGVVVGDSSREPLDGAVRGDTVAGAAVFRATCARCHGSDGAGQAAYPPLWGPRSFTIGAGMARMRTATAFIRANMPQDHPGSVSDVDALNVAAYITSRARPDFPGKANDWPRGDAPADVPYPTHREP